MTKTIGLFLSLFTAQALFAGQAEIDKVVKLANTVKSVAITSEASDQNLKLAAEKLREVIELLSDEDTEQDTQFEQCYDFAYQKYYINLSSASAADKATAACKGGLELDVLKFLYEKHYINTSASTAMDLATVGAGTQLRGKLEIIKYMYEKYYITLSATAAATKATDGARRVKKNSIGCLQKLYASYYQTQSASTAMDNAINSCSGQ